MPITQYPANVLKEPGSPLIPGSKEAREIADKLREALRGNTREGVGLSANQLGLALQAFVIDTAYLKLHCSPTFINPMIVRQSDETDIQKEGCLSFPDTVSIPVRRSLKVTVSAFDHNGSAFIVDLEGLAARVVLHEIDHACYGRTILDHASPAQKKKAMKAIAKALQMKVARR